MKGCICYFVADTPFHIQGDQLGLLYPRGQSFTWCQRFSPAALTPSEWLSSSSTQQTRVVGPMLGWCWASVADDGPRVSPPLGQRLVFAGEPSQTLCQRQMNLTQFDPVFHQRFVLRASESLHVGLLFMRGGMYNDVCNMIKRLISKVFKSSLLHCITYNGSTCMWKWNESGFRPPLCTYRLNWARRISWGWWDEWNDTVLQTHDSKFEP